MQDLSFLFKNLIAHRGLHGYFPKQQTYIPENSLSAFSHAITKRYSIELDVQMTKDQNLIVFHDHNSSRLTNISQKINTCTLSEIQQLSLPTQVRSCHDTIHQKFIQKENDPRPFYNPPRLHPNNPQKIPTLKEVLDLVKAQVPLLIELKSSFMANYRLLCQKTFLLLSEYQKKYPYAKIAIQSFDPRVIFFFKTHQSPFPAGLLLTNTPIFLSSLSTFLLYKPFSLWCQPDFLSVDKKIIHKKFIQSIRQKLPILCWTLQNPLELKNHRLLADGYIIEESDDYKTVR